MFSEQGFALQVQDHEVAIVELEPEVQEIMLSCLDEGKKRNTVNRCETVHRCESNSTKTDAGEEFVLVEPCLARISWCANRVFDELDEYHVSHGFGAVPNVVLPLCKENVQGSGEQGDMTLDDESVESNKAHKSNIKAVGYRSREQARQRE